MKKINKTSKRNQRNQTLNADDFPPLTSIQIKELIRRKDDSDDRRRYILASRLWPRFSLYYNISGDFYSWNDPTRATLFKRLNAAIAIKRMMSKGTQILTCRVDRHDKIVLRSIKKTVSKK
jgi:hypothetical protein